VAGFLKHVLSYWYPELRASLENPSTPLSAFDTEPKTTSGIIVTPEKSLAIGSVFACVRVIAETMAQMDLEVVKREGKTVRVDTSHPNYWLLHTAPSPDYNRFEFIQAWYAGALLWGNGYAWIKRDRYANAVELKILMPWHVVPKRSERGKIYYEWQDPQQQDRKVIILQEDMLHLKNLGCDGLIGLSPIEIQRESLGNNLAKLYHEAAFYSNGAKASGILMTPGNYGQKEKDNIQTSFNRANEGPKNRYKTILLEEGVKYQQLTIPQNDAQFLESRKFDRSEVAGWFRVPPYKIGDHEQSTYSNIEGQERSYAKDTIVPWAIRGQQEFDRKLFFQDRGVYGSQYNLDDLIKGDIKTRYEVYKSGIECGILKPSEPREAEGWETSGYPEIDQFFMNASMKPVRQIIAEPTDTPTNNIEQNAAA
jgi:HK97 family phage portal protein